MKNLERYGGLLDKLDAGEPLDGFYRDKPHEQIQMWFDDTQDRLLSEIDKQGYFENCLEELGGIPFSCENIKPGYLVSIRGYCMKVVKANPKTVEATDKHWAFSSITAMRRLKQYSKPPRKYPKRPNPILSKRGRYWGAIPCRAVVCSMHTRFSNEPTKPLHCGKSRSPASGRGPAFLSKAAGRFGKSRLSV